MLRQRLITALVLVTASGGVLFCLPNSVVWVIFAALAALAAWEWARLIGLPGNACVAYAGAIFVGCALIALFASALQSVLLLASSVFWLLVVPLWLRYQWRLNDKVAVGALVGGLLLLATWAALVLLQQRGPWLLLAAMALVWVADVAAYFAGRRFGKHKLAPTISPGKTWEGVAGAVCGVLAYGIFLLYSPLGTLWTGPAWLALALLPLLTAVSVIGDLFESMLKRQAGMKDSGSLLPGHGGVLDRIDSLTSTLPVAALIVSLAA